MVGTNHPPRQRVPLITGVLAAGVLVRLFFAALIPLFPDEAYYWEWSRRLAAGYFDHPPAIPLLIRGGTALFGATAIGVRLFVRQDSLCGSELIFDQVQRLKLLKALMRDPTCEGAPLA